ncbi:MAG TPA: pitrilysin family protein [Bryobacteraceae bacterium]|nr:pitrilysin family protein [Bryobacteraceae bacterium]
MRRFLISVFYLNFALAACAQSLADFEKKVTEFTLPNGLHFLLVERHEAPVVSFDTFVNTGSINDPAGSTGLAHMFEHMAFKGTETIGTNNWTAEKKAMEDIERAYDELDAERSKGQRASRARLEVLQASLKLAIGRAQDYVKPNEYTTIIEQNGGVGLNAGTGVASTEYFYSLPSNRIELWFLLEAQRFIHPVFREFYKERDVVMEEYRQRVESSPQGLLLQNFRAAAFEAHPYRNPAGGWPSDIRNLRVSDAKAFFERYYTPSNMNIAIVGDVNPAEAKRLAEKYFTPLSARPTPPPIHTEEPAQLGPRTVVVESKAQPVAAIGYRRPDQFDKDDAVFDVIAMILTNGRTSLLRKDLVQDKRLSLAVDCAPTYPDGRYPNLFVFLLVPAQGHTIEDNQQELDAVLAGLISKKTDAATMARVKTKVRAQVIAQLDHNSGLASLLTRYYGSYGDWRKLFTSIDDIAKVTPEDVQRVAAAYFTKQNRTVAYSTLPAAGGRR